MTDHEHLVDGQKIETGDDSDSALSDSSDDQSDTNCGGKTLATLEEEIRGGKWYIRPKKDDNSIAEALRQRFLDEYSNIIRKKYDMGFNIFHILAGIKDKKKSRKLIKLVEWSVEIAGDMLNQQDSHGQTCLHKAIHNGNYRMLNYLLDAYDKYSKDRGWDLDQILKVPSSGHSNNVVHLAIKHITPVSQTDEKPLKLVQKFIDNASIDTLKMQNKDGLTPLHLAVQGEKCTVSQLGIVERLVNRCEEALDIREYNNKFNSVYQHHNNTFDNWKEKTTLNVANRKSNHLDSSTNIDDGASFNSRAQEIARGDSNSISGFSPIIRTNTTGNYLGSTTERSDMYDQQGRRQKEPLSVSVGHQLNQSPQTSLSPRERTEPRGSPNDDVVTEKNVRKITNYLKHTYLRKKSRHSSLDFLYGGIAEKQIDFNIYGKEGEISEKDFKLGYKCANLEDTLQCVRIPYLIIQPTPEDESSAKQPYEQSGKSSDLVSMEDLSVGRTDLGIVFRWLWHEAKVSKIIKLSVDDSHHPPHRDEAIEKAAKPFQVEVWDWQKIDLCCETIAVAAPNARQVNLYWSGNNAVLRGWSNLDGGLAKLTCLEKVTVFLQSRGVEIDKRNRHNFDNFELRLKESRISSMKKDDAVQIHRWHKCMGTFGQFFLNVDRSLQQKPPPIKIAIIDDGIDTTVPSLHNYIAGGQCFSIDDSPSFCVSTNGHGTAMARLILRVFPQAQILSLKLDDHLQSDGKLQFSVESAIKAIRWAKTAGVSIVNMSWSIERTEANEKMLPELRKAVNDAEDAKILMFCSSNDQGKTKDNSYPGAIRRGTLFKIGAATAAGEESNYVSLDDVDFLFPGRAVEKDQVDDVPSNEMVRPRDRSIEGSSIATAFASGLAGLILYIFQLVGFYYDGYEENDVVKMSESLMKDPGRMKDIFEKLATDKKFVEVWRVFENADEQIRTTGRGQDNRFKILSEICSKLIN